MLTRGFMLNTSAINRIYDWQQCPWSLRGPLYVTDIQLQELSRTPGPDRRAFSASRQAIRSRAARNSGEPTLRLPSVRQNGMSSSKSSLPPAGMGAEDWS